MLVSLAYARIWRQSIVTCFIRSQYLLLDKWSLKLFGVTCYSDSILAERGLRFHQDFVLFSLELWNSDRTQFNGSVCAVTNGLCCMWSSQGISLDISWIVAIFAVTFVFSTTITSLAGGLESFDRILRKVSVCFFSLRDQTRCGSAKFNNGSCCVWALVNLEVCSFAKRLSLKK